MNDEKVPVQQPEAVESGKEPQDRLVELHRKLISKDTWTPGRFLPRIIIVLAVIVVALGGPLAVRLWKSRQVARKTYSHITSFGIRSEKEGVTVGRMKPSGDAPPLIWIERHQYPEQARAHAAWLAKAARGDEALYLPPVGVFVCSPRSTRRYDFINPASRGFDFDRFAKLLHERVPGGMPTRHDDDVKQKDLEAVLLEHFTQPLYAEYKGEGFDVAWQAVWDLLADETANAVRREAQGHRSLEKKHPSEPADLIGAH